MAITYLSGGRIQGHSNPNNTVEGYGTEQINTDFSSSTGWTVVGNRWSISSNKVLCSGYSSETGDDFVWYDLGASFHCFDQDFVMDWESKVIIASGAGYIEVGFTNDYSDAGRASGDMINGSLNGKSSPASGYTRINDYINGTQHEVVTASSTNSISSQYNTTVYLRMTFNSTTNVLTLDCYSDSARTTKATGDNTQSLSTTLTMSNYQNMRYLFAGSVTAGGRSLDSGCYVDNLVLYTGSTTIVSDKTTITDVPTGTRFEETDTRKIFRYDGASDGLGSDADGGTVGSGVSLATSGQKLGTGCLDFDGTSNGKVDLGNSIISGTGDHTFSCWFNADDVGSGNKTLAGSYASGNQLGTQFMINNGELRHYYGDGRSSSGASISADTWYHYCVTRTSGVVKGYINGTEVYSATHTTDIGGDTNHFLGAISTGGEPYNGEIDDVGFWNVGLIQGTDATTVNSVRWLYNGGTGRLVSTIPTGLKAYYSMDSTTLTNKARGWVEKGTA